MAFVQLNYIEKLEARCDINIVKRVLKRLREVHPYEEPAIDIILLIAAEQVLNILPFKFVGRMKFTN